MQKKILVLYIIIGILLTSNVALALNSKDIKFSSSKSGFEAENVSDALDILYGMAQDPEEYEYFEKYDYGVRTTSRKASLTLSKGKYVVMGTVTSSSDGPAADQNPNIVFESSTNSCTQLVISKTIGNASTSGSIYNTGIYICDIKEDTTLSFLSSRITATASFGMTVGIQAVKIK